MKNKNKESNLLIWVFVILMLIIFGFGGTFVIALIGGIILWIWKESTNVTKKE